MDINVSRQLVALVISFSSCFIRVPKSEKGGPGVGWFGGGPRGCSGSQNLNVVLEVLFRVIVIEVFDIRAFFRPHLSGKAVEHGGRL